MVNWLTMKKLTLYGLRNRNLERLGLGNYRKYLRSDLWESIRYLIWERDGGTCQACGKRGHATHHMNYREETLLGDDLGGLILLCAGCHKHVEFRGKRKLTCGKQIQRRLEKRIRKFSASTR